jgi:hypothetical protein
MAPPFRPRPRRPPLLLPVEMPPARTVLIEQDESHDLKWFVLLLLQQAGPARVFHEGVWVCILARGVTSNGPFVTYCYTRITSPFRLPGFASKGETSRFGGVSALGYTFCCTLCSGGIAMSP